MIEAQVSELLSVLSNAVADAAKFDRGNDAAGRRLRKACMEVARACKSMRADIQEVRNNRK